MLYCAHDKCAMSVDLSGTNEVKADVKRKNEVDVKRKNDGRAVSFYLFYFHFQI